MNDVDILPAGTIVGGKYEILKEIGRGGMSVVYLVMDTHLRKNWALKEIRKDGRTDYEIVKQGFIIETEMLKKLSHPSLPRIVDMIEGKNGFCIVMDFIEGQTLSAVINERGPCREESAVRWARQLSDVLIYLHSRNPPVIFRDIKPGNIMLKPEGDVVLFDFGIAREYKEKNSDDTVCLGTPGYAAPEQFGGRGQTDPRSDIYSLGATLYYLVTGRSPGELAYMRHVQGPSGSVSAGLEKIIFKCTRPDPAERYQSCADLLYDLRHIDEIDDAHKRMIRHHLAAFAVPFSAGIFGLALAAAGFIGNRREVNRLYLKTLTEVSARARDGIYSGEYSPEIVNDYVKTIEINPSRKEAYLRLLDYCESAGQIGTGLYEVCLRIDSGAGGINKNDEVLYRTASVYFGGEGGQIPDYTKAGKYFSMINKKDIPEAEYYAALSGALSSFGGGTDLKALAETMNEFENLICAGPVSVSKVRNEELLAGIYISYKRNIAALQYDDGKKIDPYERAVGLLTDAENCIEDLEADERERTRGSETEIRQLHKQILKSLADCYANAGTVSSPVLDYDKAIMYYTEFISMSENDGERREAARGIGASIIAKGEDAGIRLKMKELMELYPDDAGIYLEFASYLIEKNEFAEAAELLKKAEKCEGEDGKSNMETVRMKLEAAGTVPAAQNGG